MTLNMPFYFSQGSKTRLPFPSEEGVREVAWRQPDQNKSHQVQVMRSFLY